MIRTILLTTALATAAGLFALGARAQAQQQAQTQGGAQMQVQAQARIMSIAEVAARLEAQGYLLREIELERGVYEVEMTDANGMRVEAHLDAVTGEVLPYRDDEDRDGYRDRDDDRDRDWYRDRDDD